VALEPILTPETVIGPSFWLDAAHAAIRGWCGWHVAPVITETLVVDGSGHRDILIRSGRVVELLAVVNDGEEIDLDDVDFSRAGILELRHGGHWSRRLGGVEVILRHGYEIEDVPDVAALIATLARRGASAPGIVARQSVNGASVDYLTAGGAPLSIPLLGIEKEALDRFRLVWEA